MFSALWNLLFFAIALGILVTIHEAGHFFAARLCKVKVLRFSLGFGKVVYRKVGRDGCEYAISSVPLGGYVQMLGEGNDEVARDLHLSKEEIDKGSFKNKTKLQRAFIIGAGPFCNIFLAVIIYSIINMSGVYINRPVVGYVHENTPAYNAGFAQYDLISRIDGRAVEDWNDVIVKIVGDGQSTHEVELISDVGKGSVKNTLLDLSDFSLNRNTMIFDYLGFIPCFGRESESLTMVEDNGPAFRAGVRVGDEIVAIDGIEIKSFTQVSKILQSSAKNSFEFIIKRDGVLYNTKIYPEIRYKEGSQKGLNYIGVGVGYEPIEGISAYVQYGFFDAVSRAMATTYEVSTLVVKSISLMITGAVSTDSISGPIGIAKEAGDSASGGILHFLGFLAIISVNLGIFNLLPVPVLDGGQLIFIAYEAVFRKAPNAKVQYVLTALGLGILVALTIFAVFNDLQALL